MFYWVYRVLPGFTGFFLGFTGFYWVLPGFTGFYWVLLGLGGFYQVFLWFTGRYWVFLGLTWFWSLFYSTKVVDRARGRHHPPGVRRRGPSADGPGRPLHLVATRLRRLLSVWWRRLWRFFSLVSFFVFFLIFFFSFDVDRCTAVRLQLMARQLESLLRFQFGSVRRLVKLGKTQ